MRGVVAKVLAVLLAVQTLFAADRSAIRTDWKGFREQVAQLKLKNRGVRIGLTAGGETKAFFLRAEENGLVVRADKAVRQWKTSETEATVPRDTVSTVRFNGRVGRGGTIGGLAGAGLGSAITAGVAANSKAEGSAAAAALLLIPLLAGLGYLAGHSADRPAPSFTIVD